MKGATLFRRTDPAALAPITPAAAAVPVESPAPAAATSTDVRAGVVVRVTAAAANGLEGAAFTTDPREAPVNARCGEPGGPRRPDRDGDSRSPNPLLLTPAAPTPPLAPIPKPAPVLLPRISNAVAAADAVAVVVGRPVMVVVAAAAAVVAGVDDKGAPTELGCIRCFGVRIAVRFFSAMVFMSAA